MSPLLLEGDLSGNTGHVSHYARDVALSSQVFGQQHIPWSKPTCRSIPQNDLYLTLQRNDILATRR